MEYTFGAYLVGDWGSDLLAAWVDVLRLRANERLGPADSGYEDFLPWRTPFRNSTVPSFWFLVPGSGASELGVVLCEMSGRLRWEDFSK